MSPGEHTDFLWVSFFRPSWPPSNTFLTLAFLVLHNCHDSAHKHIPEMAKYSGLGKAPIFQPQIADFAQGMVVNIPLHYAWLAEGVTGEKIHSALKKHYEGSKFIEVMPLGETGVKEAGLLERGAFLRPDTLANTNKMQLFVFANDEAQQAVLSARLDNLGKGASGAAVQNLNIALGLDEAASL
jgi:N-acetyl-gamma-glutamyl-phosphate reductase